VGDVGKTPLQLARKMLFALQNLGKRKREKKGGKVPDLVDWGFPSSFSFTKRQKKKDLAV